jgi:hypothetical protein
MKPVLDPNDATSVSPQLASMNYRKVMVIPPSGTARGAFDKVINLFEREFLRNGITVISGAITGRVAMKEMGEEDTSRRGGSHLSDAERALIMAKETGADALLQIGQFDWSGSQVDSRFFVLDTRQGATAFREATLDEYQAWTGMKRSFQSEMITFIGRLTDVSTGEIMASFKVEAAANWNLPTEYVATINQNGHVLSENFTYGASRRIGYGAGATYQYVPGSWVTAAKERIVQTIIGYIARKIMGGR